MTPLNAEEQEIFESVENGEWQSISDVEQEIQRYKQYAQASMLESVNIKIPASDFQSLQILAQQTDTPVSILMANVLHQYIIVHQSFFQS
jgi:predicted DNA binding CopG/RHH family protein